VATLHHVFVQAYNTDKVRREDLPKNLSGLLASRWKGKLAIEGDDHEWVSFVIADMGEAEGVKFFRDLVAGNGLSVRSGHPLLTNLVSSGEVPLALTVYQYSVEQAKKKGSPIDWFVIEPAVSITNAIGVARRRRTRTQPCSSTTTSISAEGQRMLAKIGYVPTHPKIESPVKDVRLKFPRTPRPCSTGRKNRSAVRADHSQGRFPLELCVRLKRSVLFFGHGRAVPRAWRGIV